MIDVEIGYLFHPSALEHPMFDHLLEMSDAGVQVFVKQDQDATTKVQRGLNSRFAVRGRYSWQEESHINSTIGSLRAIANIGQKQIRRSQSLSEGTSLRDATRSSCCRHCRCTCAHWPKRMAHSTPATDSRMLGTDRCNCSYISTRDGQRRSRSHTTLRGTFN